MRRLFLAVLFVMLLASVSTATSISVMWPANPTSDGVVNYSVYMKANNSNGTGFVKGQDIVGTVQAVSGVTPNLLINNVVDSTNYCFRITATDDSGVESGFSLPAYTGVVDTVPPGKVGPPTIKLVRTTTSKYFVISWPFNPAADGVKRYKIYLRADNTDGSGFVKNQNLIGSVGSSIQTIKYIIKYTSSSYCVRVTAVDAIGNEGEFSNPAFFGTVNVDSPTKPANPTIVVE